MATPCTVIYKGKKYTEEEFRKFIQEGNNHLDLYNEFVKSPQDRVEAKPREEVKLFEEITESARAKNALIDKVRKYNELTPAQKKKQYKLANEIRVTAQKLNLELSEKQGNFELKYQGKAVVKTPIKISKERIESQKLLNEYDEDFQGFVNDVLDTNPNLFGVLISGLTNEQRAQAFNDIRNGKKTLASMRALSDLELMYKEGGIRVWENISKTEVGISLDDIRRAKEELINEKRSELNNYSYQDADIVFKKGLINQEEYNEITEYIKREAERADAEADAYYAKLYGDIEGIKAEEAKPTKAEQLKVKEEEIKNRLANDLEDLMSAIGGIQKFSGEQRAKVIESLQKVIKDLAELTALKGEQLYQRLKEYLAENKVTIPDDVLQEATDKYEGREAPPPKEEVPPPTIEEEPAKEKKEPKEREKTLLNRFLKSAKLSDKFKEHLKKHGTTYTSIPNDITVEEADYILADNGTAESESMVYNTRSDMSPRVRALLGIRLIALLDSFADAAFTEGDLRSEAAYRLRSVNLADWLDEKMRDLGRGIQILASTEVSATLSPKSQVIRAKRMMRKQRDNQIDKSKKDIDSKKKAMKKANEESVDEVLKSKPIQKAKEAVTEREEPIAPPRVITTREKIKREQDYRKKQWDIFKKAGKEELSVSIAGLNTKQIEAIGNIVASYVREGITRTEDLIKRLQKEWFDNTGTKLSDKDARELLPKEVDGRTLEDIEEGGEIDKYATALAKRVQRMLKDPKVPKDDPVRQMLETLLAKIQEKDTKEKVTPEKKSDLDKIREALTDRDTYAEVWEAAKEKVDILIESNKELSEDQRVEYRERLQGFYDEVIGVPFSQKQAEKAARKGIKDLGIDIDKVIRDHYTVYDATKRTLQEKLIEELGLGEAESRMLAEAVGREFDKIALAKKKAIIQRGIKPKEITQFGRAKMVWEKLIELTNMGAFSDAEFAEAYADAWGFPKLTAEQVKELERLAKRVYDAPEGFQKYEAIQDLLAYQAKIPGLDIGDFALGMWYSMILSGFRTQFKNVFANTMNTIAELGVSTVKDPRNFPGLVWGLLNGWQRGGYEFMYVLRKGYMPIRGFKIESPIDLELKKFRGGGWNPMNWFKYVPRFMVAADAFSYGGLKEMRAYEMALNEARKLNKEAEAPTMETWKQATEILNKTSERLAEAEAQTIQEGFNKNSKVKSERNAYHRRVWEIMEQGRGQTIVEDTSHFAAHGTFNYPPEGIIGFLTEFVSTLTHKMSKQFTVAGRQFTIRPLKFVVPFTRIIANVADVALDYYPPVGALRYATKGKGLSSWEGGKYANKYKKYTEEERKKVAIKAAIGLSTQVTLFILTAPSDDDEEKAFEITANGYGDYKKNYELKESGWQPYSIKIGKTWLSYQYTPLVLALAPIGFLRDAQKYKSEKYKEKDLIELIGLSYFRSLAVMGDMTWATSLSGIIDIMYAPNEEQAIGYAKNMFVSTAKGMIYPKFAEQTVQFIDMAMENPRHEASTVYGKIMRDIPIVRNKYNTMLNAVGEPVMYDPIQMLSRREPDAFWDFINKHKINIGKPNQKAVIWDDINKVERGMTDDEYYNFILVSGQEIKRRIMEEVMTKDYPDEMIKKKTDNIKTEVRNKTKIEMFGWGDFRMKNPEEWKIIKDLGAIRPPRDYQELVINRKPVALDEQQLNDFNNLLMQEYTTKVLRYIKRGSEKIKSDKETIDAIKGMSKFDIEMNKRWAEAAETAKDKTERKIRSEQKQ